MLQPFEKTRISRSSLTRVPTHFLVELFLCCLLFGQSVVAAPKRDHLENKGAIIPPATGRQVPQSAPQTEEGCPVNPGRLAAFANGTSYDMPNMVTYLTSSGCDGEARSLAKAAIGAGGVTFSDKPPFRLDYYAKAIPAGDWDTAKRMDVALTNTIPGMLRQSPRTSSDLLPLLGQVALISRNAGRITLAQLIEQELITGDSAAEVIQNRGKSSAITELAANLIQMGAGIGLVASDLADVIQDQALIAQANSLKSVLTALADAATVESALVPTFNVSAGAMSRGVLAGQPQYTEEQRREMMQAVYAAIRSALKGSGALEPGAAELNEAMVALMGGTKLTDTVLRRVWKEAVGLLATSATQSALAEALALSLTPEIIFLKPGERQQLLAATRNYPVLAVALQHNFLLAWNRVWNDLRKQDIPTDTYNRFRKVYFQPLVAEMLDLDPTVIESAWLKEVVRRGLVSDDDLEKKFPKFVLAFLDRREKAAWAPLNQSGPQPIVTAMAESFAVVWTLSNVHMPALMDWVRRNE